MSEGIQFKEAQPSRALHVTIPVLVSVTLKCGGVERGCAGDVTSINLRVMTMTVPLLTPVTQLH